LSGLPHPPVAGLGEARTKNKASVALLHFQTVTSTDVIEWVANNFFAM